MKLLRTATYALIAVLLVGAVGAGVTTAAKSKRKTKVTIGFQGSDYGDVFSGKVKPKKARGKVKKKCRKARKVVVYRRTGSGKQRIGSDKTNRRGRYTVNVGGLANPGSYFAKAKKKNITARRGTKVTCKRGKSKRIAVS